MGFFKSSQYTIILKVFFICFLCLQPLKSFAQDFPNNTNNVESTNDIGNIDTILPLRPLENQPNNGQQPNLQQPNSINPPEEPVLKTGIVVSATLTEGGPAITNGMIWRIYSTGLGPDQKLKLLASSKEGVAHFDLNPGSYLLLGSFGRAQVMRRITLIRGQDIQENFVINAGGLKLYANLPEGEIHEKYLRFSIYTVAKDDDDDEQTLIMDNIKPGELVRLEAGTYDVVSSYGTENATVRFNTTVEAGRIIDITIPQRAAQVTLKLVRQEGGEALAETRWSILNDSGDIVRESNDANVVLVLMEGDYVAIAKNKDQIYQKNFSVQTGSDQVIDIVADYRNQTDLNTSQD